MNGQELIKEVIHHQPTLVPSLLLQHLSLILADYETLFQLLVETDPSPQVVVARIWVSALEATNGAFWDQTSSTLTVTRFGAALLSQVSLQLIGEVSPVTLHDTVRATEAEYLRLNAVLQKQTEEEGRGSFHAMLLGWIVRAAISYIPRELARARERLGLTAIKIISYVDDYMRQVETTEQLPLLDGKLALHASAAECFPHNSHLWAMSQLAWAGELEARYDRLNRMADLEEAIFHYSQAATQLPSNSPEGLGCKFMWEGAIHKRREAQR
jgi:hypothetical protein